MTTQKIRNPSRTVGYRMPAEDWDEFLKLHDILWPHLNLSKALLRVHRAGMTNLNKKQKR